MGAMVAKDPAQGSLRSAKLPWLRRGEARRSGDGRPEATWSAVAEDPSTAALYCRFGHAAR